MTLKIISDGTPSGTKVIDDKGNIIDKITKIEYVCEQGKLPIAKIEFLCLPVEIKTKTNIFKAIGKSVSKWFNDNFAQLKGDQDASIKMEKR